jgi:hypothetical protein
MPENEEIVATPELKIRAAKNQKEYMEIVPVPEHTYIIVAAVHFDKTRNTLARISCKKGVPITGYVYDSKEGSEAYIYECCDYFHLGYIPVSFELRLKGSTWRTRIPMCETTLKKFMSSVQKKDLKNFKNHFKEHRIEFIQMIDPN